MTQIQISKNALVTGRILTGLALVFLVFDAATKFFMDKLPPDGVAAVTGLGWAVEQMPMVGGILIFCILLYAIPRTSFIGAVLLTGYLGGAVASHVRVGNPLFSHTLFPVYLAIIVWLGLYLRNAKLRSLIY